MKRCIAQLLFIFAVAIEASAAPQVPPKLTSDDCLVIIRTKASDAAHNAAVRAYFLLIKDGDGALSSVKVPFDVDGFVCVRVRWPGAKVYAVTSKVDSKKATGASSMTPIALLLPYEAGRIAVADFCFFQELKTQADGTISSFDLIQQSEDEKREVGNKLKGLGDMLAPWLSDDIPRPLVRLKSKP